MKKRSGTASLHCHGALGPQYRFEFTQDGALHARAVSEWLQDEMRFEEVEDLGTVRALHVEHLKEKLREIVDW